MRRSHLRAPATALLLVTALGCGASGRPDAAAPPAGAPASAPAVGADKARPTPAASAPAASAPAAGRPGSGAKPTQVASPAAAAGSPTATPTRQVVDPRVQASPQEIPIEGVVTPACVTAGGTATLRVQTKARATIGYLAVYAGEKSGAAPPFGEGYGGNDHGTADFRGWWTGTWTVTANAPVGPARVVVVVAVGQKQRSIDVPFSVGGREANGCGT